MKTQELVSLFLEDPSPENFDRIAKYSLPLYMVYEHLEDKHLLLQYTPFTDWIAVYQGPCLSLHALALQEIAKVQRTCAEWIKIYNNSSGALRSLAYEQISLYDCSFAEWQKLLKSAREALIELILDRMFRLAKQSNLLEELVFVANTSTEMIRKQAIGLICHIETNFDTWYLHHTTACDELKSFTSHKLVDTASSFQ